MYCFLSKVNINTIWLFYHWFIHTFVYKQFSEFPSSTLLSSSFSTSSFSSSSIASQYDISATSASTSSVLRRSISWDISSARSLKGLRLTTSSRKALSWKKKWILFINCYLYSTIYFFMLPLSNSFNLHWSLRLFHCHSCAAVCHSFSYLYKFN